MIKALDIFAWAVIAKTIFNVIRFSIVQIWRYFYTNQEVRPDFSENVILTILIPLYREANIADQIASMAHKLVDESPGNVRVILICSSRETREDEENTINKLRRSFGFFKKNQNIKIIESDGNDQCKGDQLNQGLKYIEQHFKPAEKCVHWIGVYDADSLPQKGTIKEVIARASRKNVRVMQQAPLYIGRWERFNSSYHRLLIDSFCLSRALYSHMFSFKEAIGYLFSGGKWDFRLHHLIGHGYFIEEGLLNELGNFSPPSCDTSLGYKISFANYHIELLQSYDISEVPDNLRDIRNQGLVWFNGCELYQKEYANTKNAHCSKKTTIRSKIRLLQVIMTNASWAFLPIIWFLLLTVALIIQHSVLLWIYAIAIWLAYRQISWWHMLTVCKENRASIGYVRGLLVPLFSPIYVIYGCISPLRYYYLKAFRRKIKLIKTSR